MCVGPNARTNGFKLKIFRLIPSINDYPESIVILQYILSCSAHKRESLDATKVTLYVCKRYVSKRSMVSMGSESVKPLKIKHMFPATLQVS